MDSIKQIYVPDRRVEIFDFEIQSNRITGRTSLSEAYESVKMLQNRFKDLNLDSFHLIHPLDIALVNVSVGNIRSDPRHSAELSTQVLLGHQLKIWDRRSNWYYVQTPDDYLGWIDGGGIFIPSESDLTLYQESEKIMYQPDFGFCFETFDFNGPVVSDLVAGNILINLGSPQGGYVEVQFPDGRRGYIRASEARPLEQFIQAGIPDWQDIKTTAFKFMGRPYLWGGTSGKGVDCSGFTKMVYYLNGLELPRDASQQIRCGVDVPLDDELSALEPGDLLFFGYKPEGSTTHRITHVGIHLGNGRMIHSSQRVQVESLQPDDPDFSRNRRETLVAAKRMIVDGSPAQGVNPIIHDPVYGF